MNVENLKNSVAVAYFTQVRSQQQAVKQMLELGENMKANFDRVASKFSSQYMASGAVSENMHYYNLATSAYEKAHSWDPSNFGAIQKVTLINLKV